MKSLFYTSSQHYVYEKILQFFTVLLGFIYPLFIKKFSVEKFLKWFIIIATGLTIVFFPLFITGYKSFSTAYANFQSNPLLSIYQSYLTMGYIIGITLIINTFLSILPTMFRFPISLFLLIVLTTTGARGPLFGFIAVTLLFIIYNGFKIKRPKILTMLIGSILIVFMGTYALTKLDIGSLLERTYDRIVTIEKDSSANDRLVRAQFVLSKVDTEHILVGYGFGSFGYEYTRYDVRSYPHNMIFEILFELGIFGILVYGTFIISILRQLIRTKKFLPWALFIFLFFNSMKSLSLSDSRILFGFFAVILIYHTYQKKQNIGDHS